MMDMNSDSHSYTGSFFSSRFPDFEDIVELGRGGMGVVYKARHKVNGHYVVIKTMLKGGDDRQIQRFQREAEVLAELKHHNIVSIKTVGQSSGEHYFAMEYIQGQNLRNLVSESLRKSGTVPDINRIIDMIAAIAQGLVECHEKGIVHRDVKPENIVIGPDRPVLVDFGLVKQMDSQFDTTVENLTKTGQMLGTPGFMPPEQLEFNGEYGQIGPASDVWSLGATLYYCLSGQQPFGSLPFSAWCMAVVDRNPPSVKTLNPALPDWISELCSDCLERRAMKRPSMEEFYKRLELREKNTGRQAPISKTLIGLSLIIVALVGCIIFLGNRDRQAPTIELSSAAVLVSRSDKEPVTITGRIIDSAPAWIFINNTRHTVAPSGDFKVALKDLKDGEYTVSIVAEDASGNTSLPRTIQAIVDRTKPQFKLVSVVVENKLLKLDGTVSEELQSLTINGQAVRVSAGQFRHDIPVASVTGDLQFVLKDKNDNETAGPPAELFVISSKGSRHSSLRRAIQNVPLGSTIVLPPGRYRSVTPVNRNAIILGLGEAEDVTIQTDRPIEFKSRVTFTLKRLSLVGRSERLDKILLISEGSNLTIEDCIVFGKGYRVIEVDGYQSGKSPPTLTLRRSRVTRSLGPAIAAVGAKLTVESTEFLDPGPSLRVNQAKAFAAIELREGCQATFNKCRFFDLLDRGVLLDRSTGSFSDCEFRKSICEGAVVRNNSKGSFLRCQFIHNNYSGVTVLRNSEADFVECEFRANGFPNSPKERKNGLRVFYDSRANLLKSTFSDHYHNGVVIIKSTVNIYDCQFKNNKMGDIGQTQAIITRNPPRKD